MFLVFACEAFLVAASLACHPYATSHHSITCSAVKARELMLQANDLTLFHVQSSVCPFTSQLKHELIPSFALVGLSAYSLV